MNQLSFPLILPWSGAECHGFPVAKSTGASSPQLAFDPRLVLRRTELVREWDVKQLREIASASA